MTRKHFLVAATAALAVAILAPGVASAEDAVPGEIWVTLKGNDFAKPYLDGDEYSDHEFEKMGKKLVIRVDDIGRTYEFELRPSIDGFEPISLSTQGKKYKKTRVRGAKLRRMVWKTTVTFKQKKADEKK